MYGGIIKARNRIAKINHGKIIICSGEDKSNRNRFFFPSCGGVKHLGSKAG
jgi:hypothetical protein